LAFVPHARPIPLNEGTFLAFVPHARPILLNEGTFLAFVPHARPIPLNEGTFLAFVVARVAPLSGFIDERQRGCPWGQPLRLMIFFAMN